MGTLAEYPNDTNPDKNFEHCRVTGLEVYEKLNLLSEKKLVILGKHDTESTLQISTYHAVRKSAE